MLVYLAINSVTGKAYVGCTTKNSLVHRKYAHYRDAMAGSPYPFHCAIRKYGKDKITWTVLEDGITDWTTLQDRERHWIKEMGTFKPKGYNLTLGGEGAYGHTVTEEARKKMGEDKIGKIPWNKGKSTPEDVKQKQREAKLGKRHTEEARRRIAEINRLRGLARIGTKRSPETIRKMSEGATGHQAWNKGKTLSAEHRANMGKSRKGKIPTNLDKLHTAEARNKISETKRRKFLLKRLLVLLNRLTETNSQLSEVING